jgi:DNA-binding winged helix-turn-helix (wHTH) protein/predicted ATPase
VRSRVLIVGRDIASRARLAQMLRGAGHGVELAEGAAQARRLAGNGVAVAILAETGQDADALRAVLRSVIGDAVILDGPGPGAGETSGVDDARLLADVASVLRAERTDPPPAVRFAGFILDVGGHVLTDESGREIALTRGELGLLHAFVQRPGRVLSRDALLDALAGRSADAYDRSIDMLVMRLRRKIEPDPRRPSLVLTVPGSGYKFAAKVAAAEAAAPEPAAPPAVPERRYVTALSAELVPAVGGGLSTDPETLRTAAEAYRREAAAVIAGLGGGMAPGRVQDLVAFFGYPAAQEYAAEQAIRAGRALAARRPTGFAVRIGIASGLVVADSAGEGAGGEVVGEPPSEAAQLRRLAEPGEVIVSPETRRMTSAFFVYRACGPPGAPTGADAAPPAWVALGPSNLASRSEALYAEPMAPLIGREDELALLLRAWRQARSGEGRLVLLAGEAGIGKSRLLAALTDALAGEPHTELRHFCSPLHQDSALHPIIARLERIAGFAETDTAEQRRRKLAATLPPEALCAEDFALIADLLAVPTDPRGSTAAQSPQQRKERTFAALHRRLDGLARRQPVLVVFEDVHWADPTTLELLEAALDRLADLPVLFVVSHRPEFAAPWVGRADSAVITLNRLDRSQSAALVQQQVTAGRTLPPALLARIVAQADGVPLFLEELTKAVLEAPAGAPAARLAVPGTLQASLMARLDRLPVARLITPIAAAIGREFPQALLAAASGLAARELAQGLDELVAAGLAHRRGAPPDAVYAFKHALVQDLAYGTLVKARRQEVHRRIGEALRDRLPDRAAAEPEVVAHHFAAAGLVEAAVEWWGKAGELALRCSAFSEAIAHLERALALLAEHDARPAQRRARLRLQITYGNALRMARGFGAPEATAAFAHALDIATTVVEIPERCSAYYGLWTGSYGRAELAPMQRLAAAFLRDTASRPESGEAATAHRVHAMTCWFRGEFIEARAHLERSLAIHHSERDRDLAFRFGVDVAVAAMADLALVLWPLGAVERARGLAARAVADASGDRHVPSVAYAHAYAANIAMMSRDRPRAAPHAEALIALAGEHGMPLWLALGSFLRAWAAWHAGAPASGIARMHESLAAMEAHRRRIFQPLVSTLVAETEAEAGRPERGLAIVDAALASIEETGQRWFLAEALRARGQLLRACGHPLAAAEEAFTRAIAVARQQSARLFELRASTSLAGLRASADARREPRAVLAPVHAAFGNGVDGPDRDAAGPLLERPAAG